MPLACTRHPHFHQPLASHPRSSQRSQDGRRKKRRDPKTHGTGWFVHSGLTFSPIETRRGGSRDHVTNWAAPTARTDSLLKSGRCQRTCVRSSAACTIYRANKGEQKLTIREEKRKEKKGKEREREREGKKEEEKLESLPRPQQERKHAPPPSRVERVPDRQMAWRCTSDTSKYVLLALLQ